MKTITKIVYRGLTIVILTLAALTANSAPGDPGDILRFRPDGVRTVFARNIVPGGDNSGPEFLAF